MDGGVVFFSRISKLARTGSPDATAILDELDSALLPASGMISPFLNSGMDLSSSSSSPPSASSPYSRLKTIARNPAETS